MENESSAKSQTPETAKKRIAYSYIRFSRPEQLRGDSLRRQMQDSVKYAAEHNLDLDGRSMADLGISSYRSKNAVEGILATFLKGLREKKIRRGCTLIVESLDRLSRDEVTVALPQFLNLVNSGVTIVTLMDGRIYNRQSVKDPINLITSIVLMSRAHEESATKGKRVGRAWAQKRKLAAETKKPLSKICPEWLELTEKGYRVQPDRARIVVKIFRWAGNNEGRRLIAKRLNSKGVPTWAVWKTEPVDLETGETIEPAIPEDSRIGKPRGNGWQDSYVQKILNSRAVLGEFQPHKFVLIRPDGTPVPDKSNVDDRDNPDDFDDDQDDSHGSNYSRNKLKRLPDGDPIPKYFPRILSNALWENAQKRSTGPRGPRHLDRVTNLFSGVVYDGDTGAKMRYADKGQRADGKTRDWRYLVSDISRIKPGVKSMSWPYTHFERSMLRLLKAINWQSIANTQTDQTTEKLLTEEAGLNSQASAIRKKIDRLLQEFLDDKSSESMRANTKKTAASLSEEADALEAQAQSVRETINQMADAHSALTDGVEEFKKLITAGDYESRLRLQAAIRNRIKSIHLFRNGHPLFLAEGVSWPAVQITYVNGKTEMTVMSRIGPAEHHARRQIRDPKTGAFTKNTQ